MDKHLIVTLGIATEVDDQAGTLNVPVQVDGIAAGETAYIPLAAVDVGILKLTNFDALDPSNHYIGQRRLGVACAMYMGA